MAPSVSGIQKRLDEIEELEKRLHKKSKAIKRTINKKKDRIGVAENEARIEDLADQIEALRAERKGVHQRIQELKKREDEVRENLQEAKEERRKNREEYASEHFRYDEFDCHDGRKIPEAAKPAVREWCQRIGEPARQRFGPIGITSGYRPADYNASIGGATNSVHIWDYPGRNCKAVAVDWYAASGSPKDWYDFAAGKADGRGYYPNSGFTHSDTRNNIGWPDATWSG